MHKSKEAYIRLWQSEHAEAIDIGAMGFFDEFYDVFLEGEQFRDKDFSELTVIDLGAGKGSRLAERLANLGAQLIAVDWMFEDEAFPLRYEGKRVAADVLATGLDDATAHIVISANVLINNAYFNEDDHKQQYLQEILRLLKPGGFFWGEEKDLPSELIQQQEEVTDYNFFKDYFIHYFRKTRD